MKRIILIFTLVISTLFCLAGSIPDFMYKSPEEGLMEALEYYEIHHKEIVYAQAIQETGWFKSRMCRKNNNLFGLRGKHYYKYSHWSESVIAYKEKIQNRYRQGEDYYKFLQRIHYAGDPNYISTIKRIIKQKPWLKYGKKNRCDLL